MKLAQATNRGPLVQVDAHGADVAFARPVRVPDVRAAASGMLGGARAARARPVQLACEARTSAPCCRSKIPRA